MGREPGGRVCRVRALIGLGLVCCLVGLGVPLGEGAPGRLDVPGLWWQRVGWVL